VSTPDFEVDSWTSVKSANLAAVGTRDDYLIVQFRNGEIYRYPGLAYEFGPLTAAESVGKYFHKEIRHQPCQKLSKKEWPEEREKEWLEEESP
jgi:hypothetical protein